MCCVLILAAMYRMLEDHNRPENFSLDIFISDEYHRASLQELMGIITRYRSELNLLFFSTQHSRLKDYLEEWIEKSATIGMEYMGKDEKTPSGTTYRYFSVLHALHLLLVD